MDRNEYYNNIDVLFEIIHQLKYRETCFIPYVLNDQDKLQTKAPIRWMKAFTVDFLLRHMKKYSFKNRLMNLYHSLAMYDHMPTFSYEWTVKRQQQKAWLTTFQDHILAYDLFIETDSYKIEEAWCHTNEVKNLLKEFRIPHTTKFSGLKGFHIIVAYNVLKQLGIKIYQEDQNTDFLEDLRECPMTLEEFRKKRDLVFLCKAINLRLKTVFALESLDDSISDIKRVCKTGYSWDVKSGNIAIPLDEKQFEGFDIMMARPEYVMEIGIRKRGHPIVTFDQEPKLIEFIQELGILE